MIRRVIDISHYEAPIDFKKVAADGIVAIIAKARWIAISERDANMISKADK